MTTPAAIWQTTRPVDLGEPCLLGIVNCTPDSFSDGGRWRDAQHAVDGALEMLDTAVGVDIGGESTRPGSARVCAREQIDRAVPVIEGIRRHSQQLITVDTTLADVARAALDAGADAINDVAAGTEDDEMFTLAAERGCGLILMHRHCPPDQDQYSTAYDTPPMDGDVVDTVLHWLEQRALAAEAAGVPHEAICIDPGLGFGKSVAQNWALIEATNRFVATGRPVLGAASRKSFIGALIGDPPPAERDHASALVTAMQWASGMRLFRVHAIGPHAAALRRLDAFAPVPDRPEC
ncbi:MAG: dihydropteroate synthase [Phycisphaerales bacterium]|nr:dihydropteroate synthase [Phycisphaerales bacterium]